MLFTILTIVGGVLAASSLVVALRPDAKDVLAKIAPWQGILGLALLGYAVWYLLTAVLPNLSVMVSSLSGIVVVAALVLDLLIGFVLGFGLLSKLLLGRSEQAMARGKELLGKLVRVQVPLGVGAVVSGVYLLVLV